MAAVLCNCLGDICAAPCKLMGSICTAPLSCFLTVTVALNVPPVLMGMKGLLGLSTGCEGSKWLAVNSLFSIAHIAAAFYLSARIGRRDDPKLKDKHTTVARTTHLLCYDKWMAVYILVLIGFFAWLATGVGWRATGHMGDAEYCPEDISTYTDTALACSSLFISFGFFSLMFSMCCSSCDGHEYYEPDYPANTTTTQMNTAEPYAGATAPYVKHDPEAPVAVPVQQAQAVTPAAVVQPAANATAAPTEKTDSAGASVLKGAAAVASSVGTKVGGMFQKKTKLQDAQVF